MQGSYYNFKSSNKPTKKRKILTYQQFLKDHQPRVNNGMIFKMTESGLKTIKGLESDIQDSGKIIIFIPFKQMTAQIYYGSFLWSLTSSAPCICFNLSDTDITLGPSNAELNLKQTNWRLEYSCWNSIKAFLGLDGFGPFNAELESEANECDNIQECANSLF
ncbi:hypothetical protein ROZALSC1DRAFT_25873 [Rozella allomycis CSF55]|uniref:Uncharacterized protein n=1 Tax=Rozella allomycis (strain CSF55) TaxID=988480 RepID=A0A4P9Y9P9_ROZAC|nr:hypothetical protein ROZALSC1DRAFT_25873 [Rozella allomycis CSF55]